MKTIEFLWRIIRVWVHSFHLTRLIFQINKQSANNNINMPHATCNMQLS